MKVYLKKIYDSKYSELFSASFVIPIITFIALYFIFFSKLSNEKVLLFFSSSSGVFLGSSASIFGISLAALSVFVSVIYKPAIPKMVQNNLLDVFLYPFFLTIILWGVVAILSILTMLIPLSPFIEMVISFKNIFITVFLCTVTTSFLYTIQLASHVIKTTVISLSGE